MAGFVATYTYGSESADARAAHLNEHLAFIEKLELDGVLQLVGRVEDAAIDILFVLRADSIEAARSALEADPYRSIGAIAVVDVHGWNAKRGALGPL